MSLYHDIFVPVNWEFNGLKDCIYCNGQLNQATGRRYSVITTVAGDFTLRVDNVMKNDSGIYKCINNVGYGPEEASAELFVRGEFEK